MYFFLALLAVAAAEPCNRICHMTWEPVCGSDGQTYGNECELTSQACLEKKSVRIAHQGECAKKCNRICHPTWEPVCGSDGKTYGNQCELESLACLAKKTVTIAHQGECAAPQKQCNRICHPTWEPVCGSDGKTYGNQCELESLSCLAKKSVTIAHHGECQAQCQTICTMQWDPVCGSDGVTYGNECELTSTACLAKKSVRIAKRGEC